MVRTYSRGFPTNKKSRSVGTRYTSPGMDLFYGEVGARATQIAVPGRICSLGGLGLTQAKGVRDWLVCLAQNLRRGAAGSEFCGNGLSHDPRTRCDPHFEHDQA